ncbi:MAG TPA: hypothetical protein VFS21_07230 [Roseiflexaceae bacterium]|nr:hypothetical protein [Roseiflexaceae bacterium]
MDGGPPVRGERVPLARDAQHLDALIAAVWAHAGVRATPVERPLVGVALELPEGADPLETARAIDAEQVTAGFVTLTGQAAVAAPADAAHVEQAAHAVAKVIHLLWEIHTDFIDQQSDACPLPALGGLDPEQAAVALLEAISPVIAGLDGWRRVAAAAPRELAIVVDDGLALLRAALESKTT